MLKISHYNIIKHTSEPEVDNNASKQDHKLLFLNTPPEIRVSSDLTLIILQIKLHIPE